MPCSPSQKDKTRRLNAESPQFLAELGALAYALLLSKVIGHWTALRNTCHIQLLLVLWAR